MIPDIHFRCETADAFHTFKLERLKMGCHDVMVVPSVYDWETYVTLRDEIVAANQVLEGDLLVPWHNDAHLIANDRLNGGAWKNECPLLHNLIQDMAGKLGITPEATRVNIYNSNHHKHLHHDRAAFTPGLSQNMTVALSLGATRNVVFRRSKRKHRGRWFDFLRKRPPHVPPPTLLSLEVTNGSIYTFARDVNIEWQHGISKNEEEGIDNGDRISIIIWGIREDLDVSKSRVTMNQVTEEKDIPIRKR